MPSLSHLFLLPSQLQISFTSLVNWKCNISHLSRKNRVTQSIEVLVLNLKNPEVEAIVGLPAREVKSGIGNIKGIKNSGVVGETK